MTIVSTEKQALNYMRKSDKILFIILGDDNKYWLVTGKQASKLEKQGYEILRKH